MPSRPSAAAPIARRRDPYAAVLDAAIEILEEGGYGAFSIEAVAKRSGAGKTTVYRRWPSKAALFMELYNRESAALLPVEDMGSLRAELTTEITRIGQFWRETACGRAFRALIAEAQADALTMIQFRTQFLPQRRAFARAILERAVARGEIDRSHNIDVAVDMLFGFAIYRLITDDLAGGKRVVEQALDLFVNGLAPRSQT